MYLTLLIIPFTIRRLSITLYWLQLDSIFWHVSKERPRQEGICSAGTPPLPLQSWALSPFCGQLALTSKTGAESQHKPSTQFIFLAYNDISQPNSSFILFRRQALEWPRLEWGTETMNTISCSKVKKKKKRKDDCIPPLTQALTDEAMLYKYL